jgi:hypothetical protein
MSKGAMFRVGFPRRQQEAGGGPQLSFFACFPFGGLSGPAAPLTTFRQRTESETNLTALA